MSYRIQGTQWWNTERRSPAASQLRPQQKNRQETKNGASLCEKNSSQLLGTMIHIFFQNCTCQIQHPNHPTIKFCRFHIQHLLFINGTITEKPMGRTCSAMSFPTTEPQPHVFCPRKGDPKYSLEDIYIYMWISYEDIKWYYIILYIYYISYIIRGFNVIHNYPHMIFTFMVGWFTFVIIFIPMIFLVGGFNPTPLKNDGLRQLGWWLFPTEWKVIKFMFQTTNQPVIFKN